jgi:transcriptional regulator with XRE-family HTH domain
VTTRDLIGPIMKSGPEQFKDWCIRRGFMQREAADYFGWHETYISHLLSGARTPGLDNAVTIERLTGIPIEAWVSSEIDKLATVGAETSKPVRKNKA